LNDSRFAGRLEGPRSSQRLQDIGITPLADTSIRLWHWGRYSFSWEDAGGTVQRYRTYHYKLV
jgi:hypothetical protein